MSIKNSNDTIGNRTHDPPACSAVPQPTAPPRVPIFLADDPIIVWLFTHSSYVWLHRTTEYLRHRKRQVCWRFIKGWQGGDIMRNKLWNELSLLLRLVVLDVEAKFLFYGSLCRHIFYSFCRQCPFEITWRGFDFDSQQQVRASVSPDWLPDAKFITSERTSFIP